MNSRPIIKGTTNPNNRPLQGDAVLGDLSRLMQGGAVVLGGKQGIKQKMGQVSRLQEAIFDVIMKEPETSIQIEATAGSGKTTTLINATSLIQGNCLFVAFNKHIVREIEAKLKEKGISDSHCAVKTVHGIGYGCVAKAVKAKLDVNEYKYKDLVDQYLEDNGLESSLSIDEKSAVNRLLEFVQSSLTNYGDLDGMRYLIGFHDLDIEDFFLAVQIVKACLEKGVEIAEKRGIISFTDMIWLPSVWGLVPRQYSAVLGDEIQDWSAASLDLVRKCKTKKGRYIFVGDPYQSLYGFAGADPQMWDKIYDVVKASNGRLMPLSESFRCGKRIVLEARQYNPVITAHEGNPEGEVFNVEHEAFFNEVKPGDIAIARRTAPLVGACIRLIGMKKKAFVKGRDIASGLSTIIKQVAKKKGFNWGRFPEYLNELIQEKIAKASKKRYSENAVQSLIDKYEGIMACHEGIAANSPAELILGIEKIFSDDSDGIELMTIHKSKGLQAETVYILEPNKLELSWRDMQEWQKVQERNCAFVALTRAQKRLVYVNNATIE